jgi:hypothetical protein
MSAFWERQKTFAFAAKVRFPPALLEHIGSAERNECLLRGCLPTLGRRAAKAHREPIPTYSAEGTNDDSILIAAIRFALHSEPVKPNVVHSI